MPSWYIAGRERPMGPVLAGTAAALNVLRDVIGAKLYQPLTGSTNFNYTGLTITAGLNNPALLCYMERAHASNDVIAGVVVTWNGVPVPLLKVQNGGTNIQGGFLFGLLNPASGAQTLNVQATNQATDNFVNCVSFYNVTAFQNAVSANNAASLAVTSANGHIAAGVFDSSANPTILGTTVTFDQTSGTILNSYADYVVSTSASTNVGSNLNNPVIVGVDISN